MIIYSFKEDNTHFYHYSYHKISEVMTEATDVRNDPYQAMIDVTQANENNIITNINTPSQLVEMKLGSDSTEAPVNQNVANPPLLVKPKHIRRRKKMVLICKTCDYTAKTKKGFSRHNLSKAHIKKVKRETRLNRDDCNACNVKAVIDSNKCPQCEYTTDNKRSLKLHMSIHNKGLPFKCESCKFAAQNVKLLIEHYKKVTKYCTKGSCKFSSHNVEDLKAHKKICTW